MRRGLGCFSVLLIIVCVVLCVVLVGKMLKGEDTKAEETPITNSSVSPEAVSNPGLSIETQPDTGAMTVTVGQDKLRELIQSSLDDKFPLTLESLVIHENGVVDAGGKLERDIFMSFVEEQGDIIGGIEKALISLAPEVMSFSASFDASYHNQSGEVRLEPQKLIIEKLDIPVSILPEALTDKFSVAINGYASSLGYTVKSVAFYESYLTLNIE